MHEWYRYGINYKNHWRDNSKNKAQATAKKKQRKKKQVFTTTHNNNNNIQGSEQD